MIYIYLCILDTYHYLRHRSHLRFSDACNSIISTSELKHKWGYPFSYLKLMTKFASKYFEFAQFLVYHADALSIISS